MADERASFPTLEDASGIGEALRTVQEGQSVASKNGALAWAFKDSSGNAIAAPVRTIGDAAAGLPVLPVAAFRDSSGNLVFPQLNAANQLPVTFAATGNGKKARGEVLAGSATLTTVATLTLATSKTYDNLNFVVSCFRDALFQVIWNDDGVETVLGDALCGPGQFTFHGALPDAEFTSGASGTQQLLIKALNTTGSLSALRAALSVNEG